MPEMNKKRKVAESSKLFFCPESGCVKSFQQYSSLEKHLDFGKHVCALQHETLYDKAMKLYAEKLEVGQSTSPVAEINSDEEPHPSTVAHRLQMG